MNKFVGKWQKNVTCLTGAYSVDLLKNYRISIVKSV